MAPGLAWGVALAKWFILFPILSYSAALPDETGTGRDTLHSITAQVYGVFKLPQNLFIQLVPGFGMEVSPSVDVNFNTEFVLGWQPNHHGLKLSYLRQFTPS